VEELVGSPAAAALLERYPRTQVVEAVRTALENTRSMVLAEGGAGSAGAGPTAEALLAESEALLDAWTRPGWDRCST